MFLQPCKIFISNTSGCIVIQVFLIESFIVISVFTQKSEHGIIQFRLQISTHLIDAEVEIRSTDLYHRYRIIKFIGVHCHCRIQFACVQFFHNGRITIAWNNYGSYTICFRPFFKLFLLNTVGIDTNLLSIQCRIVQCIHFRCLITDIQVIVFRTHCRGRKQHLILSVRTHGYICQKIDFSIFQHLQQCWPGPLHIFIIPTCIGSDILLIIIGITAHMSVFIPDIERACKKTDTNCFCLILFCLHHIQMK